MQPIAYIPYAGICALQFLVDFQGYKLGLQLRRDP